jgi:hypothetical protein
MVPWSSPSSPKNSQARNTLEVALMPLLTSFSRFSPGRLYLQINLGKIVFVALHT